MRVPEHNPYLKVAVLVWALLVLVWLALEGSVGREVLLAGWGLAALALWLVGRRAGGRRLSAGQWVAVAAAMGLALGATLAPATLALMAVKTGLHAHGPEYTAAEVAWVWEQLPLWAAAGGLAGAGLGLVGVGLARGRD